nr:response regulator transcription factor [Herpetosiphonaceae bacterium]
SLADVERLLPESDVVILLDQADLSLLGEGGDTARPAVLLLSDVWPDEPPPARAWGIVPPDAAPSELWAAVGALAAGLCVLPPRLLAERGRPSVQTLQDYAPAETLTARELALLQLLAEGLTNRQIAARTAISEHTVKFHLSSIFSKLGVSSRTEAIRIGAQRGLVVW